MTNPLKSESSRSLGLLLARLPVGAFFILAGYQKVFAVGVNNFAAANLLNVPAYMPPGFASKYLHALPYAEIVVGSLLVLGLLTRLTALVTSAMIVSFIVAVTGVKHSQLPFHPNLIYVGVTLMLFLAGPGRISLDGLMFGKRKGGGSGGED
jgi:uncharacterized membrane protein YphA (DoxX/SURF4 family)